MKFLATIKNNLNAKSILSTQQSTFVKGGTDSDNDGEGGSLRRKRPSSLVTNTSTGTSTGTNNTSNSTIIVDKKPR